MNNANERQFQILSVVTAVAYIIALVGIWYTKNLWFILITLLPAILLLVMQKKLDEKYGLKNSMKAHWERDALLNIILVVLTILAKDYWIAIFAAVGLIFLITYFSFQTYSKLLSN